VTRSSMKRRLVPWGAALVVAVGALVAVGTSQASAGTCNGVVRFSATSNRLYVESGTQTLTSIAAQCPGTPLTLVDPVNKIWQLNADLQVENGATLALHGSAAGGDVDQLRLKSAATNLATDVVTITAMYGTLDIDHTKITSWDPATNAPDTNTALPAGSPTTARARAYIRALSFIDPIGNHESRMTIESSDLGYLGYYASEAYGVVFKARGCDINNKPICDALNVGGYEKNSHFHDNYFGTYTWDAYDMDFTKNEYDHNVGYGLDPHDDSDNLRIVGNKSHDNGNHGIICSQRCDHLTITDNESYRNGLVPWVGPHDIDASDNQVHGIMIHRGVTDSVIEHNNVHDNPNGAGIAVFESFGDTISDNTVTNNKYGLRFSVGSHDIVSKDNTLTGTTQYGIYAYRGKDAPVYTSTGGRNVDLTFANNTIKGTAGDTASISEADRIKFTGNTVTGTPGKIRLDRSTATTLVDNTLPAAIGFTLTSLAGAPNDATVESSAGGPRPTFKATVDAGSTLNVVTDDGRLSGVSVPMQTALSSSTATLKLPTATSSITTTAQPMGATAASGAAKARPVSVTATGKTIGITPSAVGQQISWSMSGFTAGTKYVVRTNAVKTGTVTADSSGNVTSTLTTTGTTEVQIKVSAT
jgi:mannuronan 5-epimerase